VLADPDGIGYRGQCRVDRSDARKEAGVGYVQIVDIVRLAVDIQQRLLALARPGVIRAG
jgi:hypothetical protein